MILKSQSTQRRRIKLKIKPINKKQINKKIIQVNLDEPTKHVTCIMR